jgi:hypothetical protein
MLKLTPSDFDPDFNVGDDGVPQEKMALPGKQDSPRCPPFLIAASDT